MMGKFKRMFERLARVNDRSIIWNNWLDYCINLNLMSNQQYKIDFKGNEEEYSEMLAEWLLQLEKELETKPYYDMLGLFYEELVTSHVKSKNIGQFFTPSEVTRLMVELALSNNVKPNQICNDCACGSGRMLLSAHVQSNGNFICIGQDLDEVSCEMAVLNFWSHGVRGSVLHQDTITQEFYQGWRVNKWLYEGLPIPHIERVSEREAYQFIGVKLNAPIEINVKPKETVQTRLM